MEDANAKPSDDGMIAGMVYGCDICVQVFIFVASVVDLVRIQSYFVLQKIEILTSKLLIFILIFILVLIFWNLLDLWMLQSYQAFIIFSIFFRSFVLTLVILVICYK